MLETDQEHKFTGVFITAEVWLHPELNCVEKCLLAEIGALGGQDGNCTASNAYLGWHVGVGSNRVSVMIAHLEKLGLVETLDFDGRRRRLRSLYQTKAAFLKTQRQDLRKHKGSPCENTNLVIVGEKKTEKPGFEVPEQMRSPAFMEAWSDWQQHRREIKHALTPMTAKRQLDMLYKLGSPAAACATIRRSIERGWQGLFPEAVPPAAENGKGLGAGMLDRGDAGSYRLGQ